MLSARQRKRPLSSEPKGVELEAIAESTCAKLPNTGSSILNKDESCVLLKYNNKCGVSKLNKLNI